MGGLVWVSLPQPEAHALELPLLIFHLDSGIPRIQDSFRWAPNRHLSVPKPGLPFLALGLQSLATVPRPVALTPSRRREAGVTQTRLLATSHPSTSTPSLPLSSQPLPPVSRARRPRLRPSHSLCVSPAFPHPQKRRRRGRAGRRRRWEPSGASADGAAAGPVGQAGPNHWEDLGGSIAPRRG